MENDKCIAFLDILGFSNYVSNNENCTIAANLLFDVKCIIQNKIIDYKIMEKHGYDERLSRLVQTTAISSFDILLALSDSIFIASDDADLMMSQISCFACDCFYFNADEYKILANQKNIVCEYTNHVQKSLSVVPQKWHPLLFRGGISYGEVILTENSMIIDKVISYTPNLLGKGIVKAVGLEKIGKGPKIFVDNDFYDRLSDEMKCYVSDCGKTKYILWPAFKYIWENGFELIYNEFQADIVICLNLWINYREEEYSDHYKEFVNLIIKSFLTLCRLHYPEKHELIVEELKNYLREYDFVIQTE